MLITQKAIANHDKILTFASWTAWASSTLVLSSRPAYNQSRKTISVCPICQTIRGHACPGRTLWMVKFCMANTRWWVKASNNLLHKKENAGDLFTASKDTKTLWNIPDVSPQTSSSRLLPCSVIMTSLAQEIYRKQWNMRRPVYFAQCKSVYPSVSCSVYVPFL